MFNGFFGLLKPAGTYKRVLQLKEIGAYIENLYLIITIGVLLLAIYTVITVFGFHTMLFGTFHDKNIATLYIDQEITDGYVQRIIDKLDGVLENKEKFAHLLIIMQSGGGSPQASEELTRYLIDFQKEGIDLTLYVQSFCASGAYYIATASKYDKNNPLSGIIANQNAVVGSIGVIMPNVVYEGTAKKLGVAQHDIVVGKYKEPISPYKVPTQSQKKYIKDNLLTPVYDNFMKIVAQGRDMSVEELQLYTEGRIFVANEVVGPIVDRISYLSKIKKEIKAKVEKDYPEDEVGFSYINIEEVSTSLFNISFNMNFDSPLSVQQKQISMK